MRKPFTLLLLPAAAIIVAAYVLGAYRAGNEQLAQGHRQLQLMAPELQSVLERFETLPFVLAQQPDLTNALARPKDPQAIARLNETLQTIQQQAKVGALYLMDRNGLTLGASNWDQPLGFAGKNFSYRPYFKAALQGQAGRFYGIGTSTSEAGYFIAQPVLRHGEIAGVIAVKISLAELERNWNSSEDPILLADRHGVIFLSNRPNWRYHSLTPLPPEAVAELASTQQYIGREVTPLARNPGPRVTQEVGRLGWQLMIFPSQLRVVRSGINWALATALLLACGAVSYWAMHQRRRRREERMAFDRELESRIAQRTQQLSETNRILRTTQNELVQAGKLAMLGQMAAGVTHELNQPLAAIRAFADNARTFLERGQPEQAASNLGHIGDASARMGAIISQLKGFARKNETIGPVDFGRAARSSAFLLESESKRRNVALEIDTGAEQLTVAGDTVRIEQVLINLLRNALDAVEGTPQPRVSVALSREGAEGVARISDNGPGIPQEVAAHLFEPFFTTKPAGQGLGLGLAISSSIVQAMNGRLAARNLDGGGAQFELRLPLIKEGAAR
ncbi:two-component system, NtrC family, C4-dicarboxylate transport sensor histidine kinase DctB [Duganella sp. CF458]|uniref:sensor histidine kinase n=1 Tax=Duganella sp. CF458 TaxID=1884368 RepID=UPI0008E38A38|nr:ATP-binding protein [Duganella sp. CF458]SFF50855.1 two-component system, NtrC family, C4-dicarboxylate transport sensor histidine kinase DctB [Duganella sp. CF458]